jgi:hypothetical protein
MIKRLLYEEKLTIEGAKKRLRQKDEPKEQDIIQIIRQEIREVLETLC